MGGLNKEKGKKENEEPIQGINIQEACYQLPALSIYYNYQRRHFIQTQQAGLQKNALKLIIRKYFYQQGQSCGFINTLRLLENLKAINDNLLAQNRYYNEGVQLLNNKQIEKAKNNFEQVIKINPNNTVAKNSRELLNFLLINMDQGGGQGQINQSYKQNTGLFALNPLLVCAFFLNFTVLFFKIKQVNQQQVYKQGKNIQIHQIQIIQYKQSTNFNHCNYLYRNFLTQIYSCQEFTIANGPYQITCNTITQLSLNVLRQEKINDDKNMKSFYLCQKTNRKIGLEQLICDLACNEFLCSMIPSCTSHSYSIVQSQKNNTSGIFKNLIQIIFKKFV